MFQRKFEFSNEDGAKPGLIRLCIQAPYENPENDFECHYSIEFPENMMEGKIIGIDELQALLLTIKHAKLLLETFAIKKKLKLTWLGMENLGLD